MTEPTRYLLDDANIDEIFEACSSQKCSTFTPSFDDVENSYLVVPELQFSPDDMPRVIQFLITSVSVVRGDKVKIVLGMIPYDDTAYRVKHGSICILPCAIMHSEGNDSQDETATGIDLVPNSVVNFTVGTIDDGKVTPSVMLVVKNLQKVLLDSIMEFFDENIDEDES